MSLHIIKLFSRSRRPLMSQHTINLFSRSRRPLMSQHAFKLFGHPLALASAALVIHIGAATAADSTSDIQQQMKEMLAGTGMAHTAPQSAPRENKVTTRIADSQDSVKQLLLGAIAGADTTKHSEVPGASGETDPVAQGDMQAAVQRALLGQPHASDAARLAARRRAERRILGLGGESLAERSQTRADSARAAVATSRALGGGSFRALGGGW